MFTIEFHFFFNIFMNIKVILTQYLKTGKCLSLGLFYKPRIRPYLSLIFSFIERFTNYFP